MNMPYQTPTNKMTKMCEICGKDLTGQDDRNICYYCETDSTPEVIELTRRKRVNFPDI